MSRVAEYPGLDHVRTGPQFSDFVASLPDERRAAVFESCLAPVIYSRHHWLRYKGEYRVRADLRGFLENLTAREPRTWDGEESDYVLSLFALSLSGIGLDELRDRVDSTAVREVLEERYALYAGALARMEAPPDSPLRLAGEVTAMRPAVELTHHLYSIIDGKAWYRTEGVIPRDEIDAETLTDSVEQVVGAGFDIAPGPPTAQRLHLAARSCMAEYGDSAPLVRGLMAATLLDPVLRADHVTLTCPMGDLLHSPELMTTSEAFFTETQLRDGVDLDEYRERLGHDSPDQLKRTIRARMLKLKRGAIRSLYGPGCLHGRFVEKHGGHMLFRNEDAHYRGHQSIGCSSGGRASFALRYHRAGEDRVMTPMVGDFRVVRMSHDERELFTVHELAHVIRYSEWIRNVVEETYRQGGVVRRDEVNQPAAVPLG